MSSQVDSVVEVPRAIMSSKPTTENDSVEPVNVYIVSGESFSIVRSRCRDTNNGRKFRIVQWTTRRVTRTR